MNVLDTLGGLVRDSGFAGFFAAGGWKNLIMIIVAFVLLYLGIKKKFEPLLLVGIAFGVLLTNLPGGGLYHMGLWDSYVYDSPYDIVNDYALYNLDEERPYTDDEIASYITDNGLEEDDIIHEISFTDIIHHGGLLDILYIGVKAGVYPCLIFMGVGAMTDFGPLIARPSSMIMGAAAQLGVFLAFFGAVLLGFAENVAASIGIIGGADGPTAII